jgi:hypothetical protein
VNTQASLINFTFISLALLAQTPEAFASETSGACYDTSTFESFVKVGLPSISITSDSKYEIVTSENSCLWLDNETGQKISIEKKNCDNMTGATVLNDGNIVQYDPKTLADLSALFRKSDSTIIDGWGNLAAHAKMQIFNPRTGETLIKEGAYADAGRLYTFKSFDKATRKDIYEDDAGKDHIEYLTTPEEDENNQAKYPLDTGGDYLARYKDGNVEFYNSRSREKFALTIPGHSLSSYKLNISSDDSGRYVSITAVNDTCLVDLQTKKHKCIPRQPGDQANFSGHNVLLRDYDSGNTLIIDPAHGFTTKTVSLKLLPKDSSPLLVADGSKTCAVEGKIYNDKILLCDNGEKFSLPISPWAADLHGQNIFLRGSDDNFFIGQLNQTCNVKPVAVACTSCTTEDASDLSKNIKNIGLASLCKSPFDEKTWDKLNPKNSPLTEADAMIWLKRFSKPGGFDADKQLPILLGILESPLRDRHPAEIKSALTGLSMKYQTLGQELSDHFQLNGLAEIKGNEDCLTKDEQARIHASLIANAVDTIKDIPIATAEDAIKVLKKLKNDISPQELSQAIELVTNQLTERALDTHSLSDIFPSKIWHFLNEDLKRALGLPAKDMTDLTVIRDGNTLEFKLLGEKPFSAKTDTDSATSAAVDTGYGFYILDHSKVNVDAMKVGNSTLNTSWQYNGKKYSAQTTLTVKSQNTPIVANTKSPDYTNLWKDGSLHGVVIAGSNLDSSLTDAVTKQYLLYYQGEGFTFSKPTEIKSTHDFLRDRTVGTDKMDYFVKEAHSDGDEKNLFRMGKSGHVVRGEKTYPDGRKEIIEIVYPASKETELLNNNEFGQWVSQRATKEKKDLVYINSSCWSDKKAVYEIASADTARFVNIPTTTLTYTFTNQKDSAMRLLIDGFRNKKSYEDIRSDMQKNAGYASGNVNHFIFPDEDEYKTKIKSAVGRPVSVDIQITTKDSHGQTIPYSTDNSGASNDN